MTTGLIWAGLFILGILVGKFLIPGRRPKEEIKISPHDLPMLVRGIFTYPMDVYDRHEADAKRVLSGLFGSEWDKLNKTTLDTIKENMITAMMNSKEGEDLANKFPRDPEKQVKDPGPNEITEKEQAILKARKASPDGKYINVAE